MRMDADASSDVRSPAAGFLVALALAAGVELVVSWQLKHSGNVLSYHLLAFGAIYYLFDTQEPGPRLESSPVSIICGLLLFASAICKASTILFGDDYYHFFALLFGAAIALIAIGFRQTARYWKAILILATLSFFDIAFIGFLISQLQVNQISASISANLLLVFGYPADSSGDQVLLPTGSVQVHGGCSATIPLLFLLKVSVLFLLLFPTRAWQKVATFVIAVGVAFFFNALRIAIMAILNAAGDQQRFEYWHKGTGSNLFSILYLATFCLLVAASSRLGGRSTSSR